MGKMKELELEKQELEELLNGYREMASDYSRVYNLPIPKIKTNMRDCTCGVTVTMGGVDLMFHSYYCKLKEGL